MEVNGEQERVEKIVIEIVRVRERGRGRRKEREIKKQ